MVSATGAEKKHASAASPTAQSVIGQSYAHSKGGGYLHSVRRIPRGFPQVQGGKGVERSSLDAEETEGTMCETY